MFLQTLSRILVCLIEFETILRDVLNMTKIRTKKLLPMQQNRKIIKFAVSNIINAINRFIGLATN